MSVKNNQFVAAAALALGLTVAAMPAVAEGLLDNVGVLDINAAEVTDNTGRVLVFVTLLDNFGQEAVRPVADANGNVRLFADGSAVVALSKRVNLVQGATVSFMRANKTTAVGDPVASLKSKYKRMKVEAVTANAKAVDLLAKKSAAESLGWDTATGSPENTEYLDIVQRQATIDEWSLAVVAIRDQLSAALTAAGIDPATVV